MIHFCRKSRHFSSCLIWLATIVLTLFAGGIFVVSSIFPYKQINSSAVIVKLPDLKSQDVHILPSKNLPEPEPEIPASPDGKTPSQLPQEEPAATMKLGDDTSLNRV